MFESIVRRRENRLWYMANQTDGRGLGTIVWFDLVRFGLGWFGVIAPSITHTPLVCRGQGRLPGLPVD